MVPDVTLTEPVDVFNVMPVGHDPLCDIVEFVDVDGTPFVESFVNTFAIAVPPVAVTVPLSVNGLINGVMITVSITVAQVVGVNLSHNW